MDPRCERCRGACCESLTLTIHPSSLDFQRFLELRSVPQRDGDAPLGTSFRRNFEVPCKALIDGRCSVYEFRPNVCELFTPGGPECESTVRARRSAEEAAAILGAITTVH